MMKENEKKAVLLSAEPPSHEQEERFLSFLRKKYGMSRAGVRALKKHPDESEI